MLWSPSQGMNLRPAMPSLMSVPGAVTRTSSWPSIQSASRFVSSEARFQAVSGSASVGQAGAEVEVFVVGEAHLRLGGVGAGRVERVAPAEVALGAALHRPRHQVAGGRLAQGLALRRHPGELAGVGAGADRDPHVGVVDHPLGEGRDPFQLRVGGVLEVGGDLAVEGDVEDRVGARLQHLLVDRQQQRRGGASRRRSRRPRPPSPRSSSRPGSSPARPTLGSLTSPPPRPSRSRALVVIAMKIAWKRGSSVSSGWKAEARTVPSRIATGCPS